MWDCKTFLLLRARVSDGCFYFFFTLVQLLVSSADQRLLSVKGLRTDLFLSLCLFRVFKKASPNGKVSLIKFSLLRA